MLRKYLSKSSNFALTLRPVVDPRRALGQSGEAAAARWYEAREFTLVDRNWRCRQGEIDLIVGRGPLLVFCEVKTRTTDRYGDGADAVTWVKQKRLRGLASSYLQANSAFHRDIRFDVASVTVAATGLEVEIIEDAF